MNWQKLIKGRRGGIRTPGKAKVAALIPRSCRKKSEASSQKDIWLANSLKLPALSWLTTTQFKLTLKLMNWHYHITSDPNVLVGKPIIRGSRLAVEFILGLIGQGWSEQEIIRNYNITQDQIRACAIYAQERLNEEKVFSISR
jgi:uncharacterized protein (DUF433 family)